MDGDWEDLEGAENFAWFREELVGMLDANAPSSNNGCGASWRTLQVGARLRATAQARFRHRFVWGSESGSSLHL